MKVGAGGQQAIISSKASVETTQNLLLGTVETKKSRRVLRPLLGAVIQAPTFGGGC
jgi:hypothetical protein